MKASPVELCQSNLKRLAAEVRVPAYDRGALPQAIVHMSVGGFHRAHQAVYLDDLLHRGGPRWGICGVGLLPGDAAMRDVLKAQDCLYTVVQRSEAGDVPRVVGSMVAYLFAPENPRAVVERMAHPDCKIVSLTITEGGYFVNQGTGALLADAPDLRHDLALPHEPVSSFGFLAEALAVRRQRGLEPFTVQSCDNLPGNGHIARRMVLAFLELRDRALHAWAAEKVAFPNAMVDRIVPATKDEHRALVREKFGIADGWPVVCEPWIQWVIEDHFPLGRPAWEEVGAQIVRDVVPYELMKLRLLNAGHQAICYIGLLLGLQFADEAVADPDIRALLEHMMRVEVTELIPPVPGIDLSTYERTLVARFGNPILRDQLARLATEGSARIPKFVLPSVLERIERGGPMRALCFTVAAWFRYLSGTDERGKALPINDPMSEELMRRAQAGREDPGPLLEMRELFGSVLPISPSFLDTVKEDLRAFYRDGARVALRKCLAQAALG